LGGIPLPPFKVTNGGTGGSLPRAKAYLEIKLKIPVGYDPTLVLLGYIGYPVRFGVFFGTRLTHSEKNHDCRREQ